MLVFKGQFSALVIGHQTSKARNIQYLLLDLMFASVRIISVHVDILAYTMCVVLDGTISG